MLGSGLGFRFRVSGRGEGGIELGLLLSVVGLLRLGACWGVYRLGFTSEAVGLCFRVCHGLVGGFLVLGWTSGLGFGVLFWGKCVGIGLPP